MNPLRKIKRFFDKILGTLADRIYWKAYYLFFKEDIKINLNHPFKNILFNAIYDSQPIENVLEIGCGAGFNLYGLAEKFPKANFYGIDLSSGAILQAKKFFKKKKINNVCFSKSSVEDMVIFGDKSMDTVFSYAVLMYVGPDKIKLAIDEIMRVARRNIILCEFHSDKAPFYNDHWIYDYNELFKGHILKDKIKIEKMFIKSGDDWEKFGHIIKIKL